MLFVLRLLGEMMLDQLMFVSFELHCSDEVLEASYIHLSIQDSLQVLEVDLLSQDSLELWLVSLTMQGLSHALLVSLVIKFLL